MRGHADQELVQAALEDLWLTSCFGDNSLQQAVGLFVHSLDQVGRDQLYVRGRAGKILGGHQDVVRFLCEVLWIQTHRVFLFKKLVVECLLVGMSF